MLNSLDSRRSPLPDQFKFLRNLGLGRVRVANQNKVINGDFLVNEITAGAAISTTGTLALNRWRAYLTNPTTQTFTGQQVADAPNGLVYSLKYTVGGTGAAPATNAIAILSHRIEGQDCQDISWGTPKAKPVTVSFWVKSSIAGVFGFRIGNGSGSRSYIAAYQINVVNTWEFKTITIPGDIAGIWATDNGVGLDIAWDMGMGSAQSASPGVWNAANNYGLSGGTKITATTGATFQLAGVKLETGNIATPFIPDPIATSLAKCRRYYRTISFNTTNANILSGAAIASTMAFGQIFLEPEMRADPSVTLPTDGNGSAQAYWSDGGAAAASGIGSTAVNRSLKNLLQVLATGYSGLTTGQVSFYIAATATTKVRLDAEL